MDVKGILIDFGYTLAYLDKEDDMEFREGITSILKGHGYLKTVDDVSRVLDDAYMNSFRGEVKDIREFWEMILTNLGISESSELVQQLTALRESHLDTLFKLYDGVIPILTTWKMKYKLALVSNCPVGFSDFLKHFNLGPLFECIILSYAVGVGKPERRIYLEALEGLGLEPSECVFVSDEISDLEGAAEMGLRTILVRQGERTMINAKDPNFRPDYQCDRISEITRVL